MLPIYKQIYPNDYLMEWVMDLQSKMTAYHEFDFLDQGVHIAC